MSLILKHRVDKLLCMQRLTFPHIFKFWAPLAATWLMMAVEGPFLAAIIARLADPKFNLAAYGVAYSFALIIEAPIIMIMSASTALVENRFSLIKLRNFTYWLNGGITCLMLIFLIPHVFFFVTSDLIGLPPEVSQLTFYATLILLPWPGAIGYRRFYQGILIRNNLTRRVAYGTIVRLMTMSCTAIGLYLYGDLSGVVVGAAALSAGVVSEAAASRIMSWKVTKELMRIETGEREVTYAGIARFYYPLALTSMIALGVHPLVTFFVGQSRSAIESLAVLPVITSLVFIFRSLGLSYQETAISLIGRGWHDYDKVKEFAFLLFFSVVAGLGLIAFTPAAEIWFGVISGLSQELTRFSRIPLMIMCIMPGLSVILSFQRAILVSSHKTAPITWATIVEVTGIIAVLAVAIGYLDLKGAVAATLALVTGRLGANAFLIPKCAAAVKRQKAVSSRQ